MNIATRFFLINASITFLLLGSEVSAQSAKTLKEEELGSGFPNGVEKVEVRQLKIASDGQVIGGSLPDSLDGKYFIDEAGQIYKHFKSLEQADAHFRGEGYYPRNQKRCVKDVIYVSKVLNYPKGLPKAFQKVDDERKAKMVR